MDFIIMNFKKKKLEYIDNIFLFVELVFLIVGYNLDFFFFVYRIILFNWEWNFFVCVIEE